MSNATLTPRRPRRAAAGPTAMDPRVRARRVAVARDQGRRRLRRLVVLAVIAGVVVAGFLLVRSPALDVDRIEVSGNRRLDAAAVRAASVPLGRAMVSVDEDAVARRLEGQPWIATARVQRRWPGTLRIAITERRPAVVVRSSDADGADAVLVDPSGVVLGPADTDTAARLPTVLAAHPPAPGQEVSARAQRIIAALHGLAPDLRRQVTLGTTRGDGIRVELDDGIVVVLGEPGRMRAKSDAVLALLDLPDRDTIARIDASLPGSLALTRHQGGVS